MTCRHFGSCTIDRKNGCDGDGGCWLYEPPDPVWRICRVTDDGWEFGREIVLCGGCDSGDELDGLVRCRVFNCVLPPDFFCAGGGRGRDGEKDT